MNVQIVAGFGLVLLCSAPTLADPIRPAASATTSGAPAASAPQVGANGASNKPPDPAKELICKRVEVTGSHMGKERVCKTRKAWVLDAEDNDEENARDRGLIDNRGANNVPR
ncbi:MAG TPA: hypothetical protein VGI79_04600 [Caulobacteraceae bacterium]